MVVGATPVSELASINSQVPGVENAPPPNSALLNVRFNVVALKFTAPVTDSKSSATLPGLAGLRSNTPVALLLTVKPPIVNIPAGEPGLMEPSSDTLDKIVPEPPSVAPLATEYAPVPVGELFTSSVPWLTVVVPA